MTNLLTLDPRGWTEQVLVAQSKTGNPEALGELTQRFYQRMYRTALRIVRDPSDAEDVVQDVFCTVMQKIGGFRGEAQLSTWLTSITYNAAVNQLRKKKRRGASLEDIQAEQPNEVQEALARENYMKNPEEGYLERETQDILEEGLSKLQPHYRAPMTLRLVDDLSVEEISERLNIPVGTVKVQLFRGRQAMKKFIGRRLRPAA